MKTSEIKKEAKNLINDVFKALLENNDKDTWKKAMNFINETVAKKEATCADDKFIWREVRSQISTLFGKKFVCQK